MSPVQSQPERLAPGEPDEVLRRDILALVPGAASERGLIDFDKLSQALGDVLEPGRERFTMTWPGKAAAARLAHTPSLGTLRPMRDASVAFDDAEHVIIEGDNLEVLKLLQRSYNGRVKVIYIDPPYNTGHDFVYEDDFKDPLASYLAVTGQVGEGGERLSSNLETDGRYHSRWLSMMLPRLALARNLLRQDGVIFISIDDIEVANLRKLCDEVFGEENFISTFIWNTATAGGIRPKHVSQCHEYVLMYARDKDALDQLDAPLSPEAIDQYDKEDEQGIYREKDFAWRTSSGNKNQRYGVVAPDGSTVYPADGYLYRFVKETFDEAVANNLVVFKKTKTSPLVDASGRRAEYNIYIKKYLGKGTGAPASLIPKSLVGLSSRGTDELAGEFDGLQLFNNPKSTDIIRYLLGIGCGSDPDALILDFFAGSGTTAEAVLQLNAVDGGKRRFILVQLPEPTKLEAYPTIADITRERVRRVIARDTLRDGFRAFRLDSSNIRPWDAERAASPEGFAEQLELHVEPILPDRSDDDILFEIMERSGVSLAERVETHEVEGQCVYAIGDLFVCLSRTLTLPLLRSLAALKPARVVVLDAGFRGDDALKANAVETMRTQGVLSFKSL